MPTQESKVVYFLGAGFSKESGGPAQNELLKFIFGDKLNGYTIDIVPIKIRTKNFLKEAFLLHDQQLSEINLEDILTPLDRCISQNTSFRGYSLAAIRQIRDDIMHLISLAIDNMISESDDFKKEYVIQLVKHIISRSKTKNNEEPSISIISTNWDILLDKKLFQESRESMEANNPKTQFVINYGTTYGPLSNYEEYLEYIPDFDAPFSKEANSICLLKVHGSLNWLICPNCNRLYVDPDWKVALNWGIDALNCRVCSLKQLNPNSANERVALEPFILLPTFLKDINHAHMKQIWNSAARELEKAKKLVFIGYSLPLADYEIRQLLMRFVPDNCKIEVVLWSKNGRAPSKTGQKFNDTETYRYQTFFGKRKIKFHYKGADTYINNLKQ